LEDVLPRFTCNTARVLHLPRKGRVQVGVDADSHAFSYMQDLHARGGTIAGTLAGAAAQNPRNLGLASMAQPFPFRRSDDGTLMELWLQGFE
jgi:hypothetical protein